jgi:Tol biopolymer transport system component
MLGVRSFGAVLLCGLCWVTEIVAQGGLPLEPARTIRFETEEVTWMSLDVSPDGGTIVFDLLGDLYTLPISGGRAMRITEGMAFDSQPRYSPDGTRIAFISDRSGADNVWIADSNGENARAVTSERHNAFVSPEWTPDGRSIVVSKSIRASGVWGWAWRNEVGLYAYAVAGGTGIKLDGRETPIVAGAGESNPGRYFGAAFGPDGELFASLGRGGQEDGSWQIVSMDLLGQWRLRTNAPGSALRPVLSPDGRHLVYATRRDERTSLRLMDLDSGDERWLFDGATRDAQREGSYDASRDLMPASAFLPRGDALIASDAGKLWRIEVPSGRATQIPFTATVEQSLGALSHFAYPIEKELFTVRQIRGAVPSPDGRRLVFTALDRLWIMSLPNGSPRRLTRSQVGEHSPVWSPDGRYVAYVTWDDSVGGTIQRIDARNTGSLPERLSPEAAFYEKLAYTPDGSHLLAARAPTRARVESRMQLGGNQLRRIPGTVLVKIPDTGGAAQIVAGLAGAKEFTPTFYGRPHFGSSPDRVHFYDPRDGLVSMRLDGSDRRTLLRVTGFGWTEQGPGQVPADEIVLSPDGRRALAQVKERVYLVELPPWAQARAPEVSIDDLGATALPVRRLTEVGGDFMGWSADGREAHYSLGHSYFTYDLESGRTGRLDVAIRVPRDRPAGVLVFRGARLVTMRADEVIESGDLLVVDDRIAGIGAYGALEIPDGARVVDVSGKTIVPGFVDVHAHAWPAWGVHRTQVWEYLVNLAYGVTTLRDPQSWTSDLVSYGDLIEAGGLLGPRVYSTGRGVFAEAALESLDDARNILRRYSDHHRTQTVKQYLVGDRLERQWFVMAARELGLTPTTEGAGDLRMKLTLAMDGYAGLEHAIRTFPLHRDVVEFLARSGTAYDLTAVSKQPDYFYRTHGIGNETRLRRFTPPAELDSRPINGRAATGGDPYNLREKAADAARIAAAGGIVAIGSHGELQGLGTHWEVWATQSGGMTPHQALRAATLSGAEAIGLARDLGSLESGKLADLLVLDKNPLQDITNTNSIRLVMKNGRLYEPDTLAEIWPRRRELSPQWWEDERP